MIQVRSFASLFAALRFLLVVSLGLQVRDTAQNMIEGTASAQLVC